MFRTTDMVLIAVMLSAAAFTYKTKDDAENQLKSVKKIQADIRYEEDTIDLLKADWSLLTQPSRLQILSEAYQSELQLQLVDARQIVGLDALPVRPLTIEDLTRESPDLVAATPDQIVTGGIAQ